jgi:hypothetical protein
VALLQHLLILASACATPVHVPEADVAHLPDADVAVSQSLVPVPEALEVPIVVDLLRGRNGAGRPLLGEVLVTTIAVQPDAACAPTPTAKRR